jgi:hypothetical protein
MAVPRESGVSAASRDPIAAAIEREWVRLLHGLVDGSDELFDADASNTPTRADDAASVSSARSPHDTKSPEAQERRSS